MTGLARTSLVLCITGGIACGKSEAGRILSHMGFSVCDADPIAHDLMRKGTSIYRQLVDHFGKSILSDDAEISRPILGGIIFENPEEREALNGMVHPAVRDYLEHWIAEKRQQEKKAAALVPLLFESEMDELDWDAILCIASSDALVLKRLEERGVTGKASEQRLASQMPLIEKKQRSDHVVPNEGTLEDLEQSMRKTVNLIMTRRVL